MRVHLNSRIKPEAERLRKHETFDVGFTGCLRSWLGGGNTRKPAELREPVPLPRLSDYQFERIGSSTYGFRPSSLSLQVQLSMRKFLVRYRDNEDNFVGFSAIFHGRVSAKILTTLKSVRIIGARIIIFRSLSLYIYRDLIFKK